MSFSQVENASKIGVLFSWPKVYEELLTGDEAVSKHFTSTQTRRVDLLFMSKTDVLFYSLQKIYI